MVKSKSLSYRNRTSEDNNIVKNITFWKQMILDRMISDEVLAKLLYHNSQDALRRPDLTEEEKHSLYNNKVFGYRYNPKIVEEAEQYITVGISRFAPTEGFRTVSDKYISGYIFFYILVNNQNMKMETGYRQDLLADRVHSLFHGDREIGIGKLKFDSLVENWEHNNKLGGYTLGFKVTDYA